MIPIPTNLGEITPAWLTNTLHQTASGRQARVSAVEWEIIGEERGFTGVVARLALRYAEEVTGEAGPASLIAKFPMAARGAQSAYRATQERDLNARRSYYARCAREVRFYCEIAPQGPVIAPRCFYAGADDTTLMIAMLLEDVRATHEGDVLVGCSPDEAGCVLDPLARFHARWWGADRAQTFAWLPRWGGDPAAQQARYEQRFPRFLERYGDRLPGELRELVVLLIAHYGAVLATLDAAPATIIHADLHLDNILFTNTASGPLATVLDWQSVCTGPAALDVASFTFGSLAPEQRRRAGDDLIRRYHESLAAEDVRNYTLDAFRRDCRLALLRQLAGSVGWLGSINPDALAGRERQLVDAALGDGRLLAALRDYDALSLLREIAKGR